MGEIRIQETKRCSMYSLSITLWRHAAEGAPLWAKHQFFAGNNGEKVGKIQHAFGDSHCIIEVYVFPRGRYADADSPTYDDMRKAKEEAGEPIKIVAGTRFPTTYHVYEVGGVSHDEAYYHARLHDDPWEGRLHVNKVCGVFLHTSYEQTVKMFDLHEGVADPHEYDRSEVLSVFMARTDVPEEWREPIWAYLKQHLPMLVLE